MYPDWPESAADLVPLPLCEGPKLKPFDFGGPQQIEFLDYLGEGLHGHVLKVRIGGQEYALKLFRFVFDHDWYGASDDTPESDRETLSAFYEYSEPFSAECRAFGRLEEAGHPELAIACHGYVLLDEAHERALQNRFHLDFDGSCELSGEGEMRARFLGKRSNKEPPLRGIVKALGRADDGEGFFTPREARSIRRNIINLQQLGIVCVDFRRGQLIDNQFSDFSTSITSPHYAMTPGMVLGITPEWAAAIEKQLFEFAIYDYWCFDSVLTEEGEAGRTRALHRGLFCGVYGRQLGGCRLRSTPRRRRPYTLVDPRRYDWESAAAAATNTGGRVAKTKARLATRPPRWYLDCSEKVAEKLMFARDFSISIEWVLKDGKMVPVDRYRKR